MIAEVQPVENGAIITVDDDEEYAEERRQRRFARLAKSGQGVKPTSGQAAVLRKSR